jgi:hypothetical protein
VADRPGTATPSKEHPTLTPARRRRTVARPRHHQGLFDFVGGAASRRFRYATGPPGEL